MRDAPPVGIWRERSAIAGWDGGRGSRGVESSRAYLVLVLGRGCALAARTAARLAAFDALAALGALGAFASFAGRIRRIKRAWVEWARVRHRFEA